MCITSVHMQFVKNYFRDWKDNSPISHVYFKEDAQEAHVDFDDDYAVQFDNWKMTPVTPPKVHTYSHNVFCPAHDHSYP